MQSATSRIPGASNLEVPDLRSALLRTLALIPAAELARAAGYEAVSSVTRMADSALKSITRFQTLSVYASQKYGINEIADAFSATRYRNVLVAGQEPNGSMDDDVAELVEAVAHLRERFKSGTATRVEMIEAWSDAYAEVMALGQEIEAATRQTNQIQLFANA